MLLVLLSNNCLDSMTFISLLFGLYILHIFIAAKYLERLVSRHFPECTG